MKILTTALFSVLMLNRSLSRRKWTSLILLTVGIALVQMDGKKTESTAGGMQRFFGLIAVTIACILSGLAGVWYKPGCNSCAGAKDSLLDVGLRRC